RHDVRERDAVREQGSRETRGAARLDQLLGDDDRVEQVAAGAADLLGKPDPEQPEGRGGFVEFPGDLAGPFPAVEVRHDVAVHEAAGEVAQRPPCRSVKGRHRGSPRPASAATRRATWPAGRIAWTPRLPGPTGRARRS